MTKPIISITDVHCKESGQFYSLTARKLENLAKVFYEWREKAERFVIKGDFFHNPNPSHALLAQCAEAFKVLGEHIWKVVFMPGNHDPIMRNLSPITAFAKGTAVQNRGMLVVTASEPYFDHEVKACYCAWSKDKLPQAPTPDWQFFGHVQVSDWVKFGSKGFTLDEIKATGFKRYYLGDFHPFVDAGKVVSVGIFGASDFGDEGLQSGYVLVNDDGSFVRHKLDYPVFHTIDIYDEHGLIDHFLIDQPIKGNIIKVRLHGTAQELTDELVERTKRTIMQDYAPLDLEVKKVYTHREAQPEKKPLLGFSEIMAKHMNSWPKEAVEMYGQLEQEK